MERSGMKMRFNTLILSQLLIQFIGIGILQAGNNSSYIDSLENVLSKVSTTHDSIDILCKLTWEYSSSDPQTTFNYGTKALSMIKGEKDPQLISEAYDAAALGHWLTRDVESAKKLYKISLKIGEQHKLQNRIAWCNYNLAQLAINENQPDTAIKYARKSQTAFHKADMDDMMINSFWLMVKADRVDQRESICREMISTIELIIKSTDDPNKLTFRYLDLSKIYELLEDQSKSLEYVLKALEVAEKTKNEKGIVTAYTTIGAYLRDVQHNQSLAIQYYQRILETYRKYNSTWGISETLDEMGIAYMQLNNDSLAMKCFTESLEVAGNFNYGYSKRQAYMHMGQLAYRRSDFTKALELFMKSYETICEGCHPINSHEIMILLGNVYSKLGDYGIAKNYYQKSYLLADSLEDKRHKAISQASLADWYQVSNNFITATSYYLQALDNALETSDLALQMKISDSLTDIYSQQNNFRNAFKYQHLSDLLEDSILSMNEDENLARIETLFEFENLRRQREVENAKAEAEIDKQVATRNLFLAGFIIMSILGVFLFISFRRKKKDNIKLAEQKRKIEDMSEKIHRSDKMKLQFFTNISHEFRTPLSLITGVTEEMAKHEIDDSTWKKQFKIIQKNAVKLLHLVNQILDIRKLDNGDTVVELTNDDLVKFISGIILLFEDYARRKEIDLKFVSEKSELVVASDFGKLDKIMSNLISNAIKFSDQNDHVRITLYTENKMQDYFVIEIEDSGRGIPEEQLQYVFQPFYQVTDSEGGSGIGLALVRELVTVLKGQVEIDSQLNKGTRVTVRIPLAQDNMGKKEKSSTENTTYITQQQKTLYSEVQEETPLKVESTIITEENGNGYERSLLIVEDNADLLDFIADILSDEYKILKAADGKKGLTMAIKYIPDIIVSDIMMPGMDGIQMCEALKNNPCTSHIPILFLTAKTDQESMLHSYKIGADDYIIKPFSAVLLRSRIQNLINQRRKLIEKFSQQFQVEPTEIILPDADKQFLDKAITVIEKTIDDPELDIDFLASEMGVSRTQLYRKLKALTDYSGNQFIRIIRLKRAAQLLSQNQLNISEVMQQTGFSNYSYFNQCFREQFNTSPKEYQQVSHGAN